MEKPLEEATTTEEHKRSINTQKDRYPVNEEPSWTHCRDAVATALCSASPRRPRWEWEAAAGLLGGPATTAARAVPKPPSRTFPKKILRRVLNTVT